jgi:hypothetical protein
MAQHILRLQQQLAQSRVPQLMQVLQQMVLPMLMRPWQMRSRRQVLQLFVLMMGRQQIAARLQQRRRHLQQLMHLWQQQQAGPVVRHSRPQAASG